MHSEPQQGSSTSVSGAVIWFSQIFRALKYVDFKRRKLGRKELLYAYDNRQQGKMSRDPRRLSGTVICLNSKRWTFFFSFFFLGQWPVLVMSCIALMCVCVLYHPPVKTYFYTFFSYLIITPYALECNCNFKFDTTTVSLSSPFTFCLL